MSKKKLLIFTPYLDIGGSEIVLTNFLITNEANYEIKVITFNHGKLIPQLLPHIEIEVINKKDKILPKFFDFLITRITGSNYLKRKILKIERDFGSDLWLINTIALPGVLSIAANIKKRTIIYVHELVQMIENMNQTEFNQLVNYPEHIICCSNAAAETFYTMGRNKNIHIIHPGINKNSYNRLQEKNFKHINNNTFVWGMSGRLNFNKSPIFFIEIASRIVKEFPNTHFIWFGNQINSPLYDYCIQMQKQLNLENHITWAGDTGEDYKSYFKSINGLLLTSVYESFSMVTLEAISQNIPVVTYNCGGVVEILGSSYPIASNHCAIDYCALMAKIMQDEKFTNEIISVGFERSKLFNLKEKSILLSNILLQ